MHKNWVIKGYDQSVTCLADDLKTLMTRSSTLRTPETLSQTNNSIHKHSNIRCKVKTQNKRSKLKVQLKSFNLQKESIESELRNSNYDQKKFEFKSAWNQTFKLSKPCSSWLSGQRGTIRRFWLWFHWIWINEQKVARVWRSGTNPWKK